MTTREFAGLVAGRIDAWWLRSGVNTAQPPLPLFDDVGLQAGDRLRMTTSEGTSICRSHAGVVECTRTCPLQWKLLFVDAAGEVLVGAAPEDAASYVTDVIVPDGAARALLGFRDEESGDDCEDEGKCCATGQPCTSENLYFDNEGLRTPPAGSSTNGCRFVFVHTRRTCVP